MDKNKMNFLIVTFALFFACANATSYYSLVNEEWELFKLQYGKSYNVLEEVFRKKIFMDNKSKVAKHNTLYEKGYLNYTMGINKFSDLLNSEFTKLHGFKPRNTTSYQREGSSTFIPPYNISVPDQIDWRTLGAVTPVKDQGKCGSDYAFSALGSLEGQHFRKTGKLVSLSAQNILDCTNDASFGNGGCAGGDTLIVYDYTGYNNGIDSEESYPYEGTCGDCKYDPKNSVTTTKGDMSFGDGMENLLKTSVATTGPVSIAIDASLDSFKNYKSGVYEDKNCKNKVANLSLAALVVGYGTTSDGVDYWIVKTSLGTNWGDEGYIKIARNKNNMCGIASYAVYPFV